MNNPACRGLGLRNIARKMQTPIRPIATLALGTVLLLTGCTAPQEVVVVHDHHRHYPAERGEVIGVAPRPGMVWRKGHWVYRGRQWIWIPGQWLHRY